MGFHYDFLLSRKASVPVSQEILIIDTGEFIETNDIFSVLITLTEMDASNLILTGRVSPSSSPVTITETEIRQRFIDEYILIGTNIRNLFEAIRSGSLSPLQAPGYVERLVELTEQGRDRLLTALIDRDEDLLRSITVFGSFMETDIKPGFDADGKLRRVKPVNTDSSLEHPVFLSLKSRYADCQIETADSRRVLWLRGHDGEEKDIPMDKNGNIITPWNSDFRRINISLFREYDEALRVMRNALAAANEKGAFSKTLPETSPLVLCDYALALREEMLKSPDSEKKEAWIFSRVNYFKSLDEFLSGDAQMVLVKGYDDVISSEKTLKEEGIAALQRMRDELSQSFDFMRESYSSLAFIHDKLQRELALSFCIMGCEGYVDYSALLANVMMTKSHINPAHDRSILLWSIAAVFIVLLLVFLLQPVTELIFGICLSVIASVAFGCVFIFYSYWIDPVIALSSSLFGTLVIFYLKCAVLKYRMRRFRSAYGTAVSSDTLKVLITSGKPRPCEVNVSNAAVIAVKDSSLLLREDDEKPEDAGSTKKMFFSSVKNLSFASGAVMAGFEGDTVLVCFGSPLDKTFDPLKKACAFVRELLKNEKITWCFGIDFGKCTFYWTAQTGFSVNGRPAVRAKMLVSKTTQLKSRILVTEAVCKKINAPLNKTGILENGESVYDLRFIEKSGL